MKIVLIGPVYPYKGGISHYTSLLYQAFIQRGHEVKLYSYKFQYPRFLYKKEQKDERNQQFKVEDTEYSIHTLNPFNWLGVAAKINKANPDMIIFQWWHPYFAPCYYMLGKLLGRQKILYICHNVFPHERFPLDKFLTKLVLKRGNYFVTQSNMDAEDLLTIKSKAHYAVTPHPTYNAFRIQNLSQNQARNQLQISMDAEVILFFGFVREYKGLKYLLEAMPEIINERKDVQLWVVGDFGSDREEYLSKIVKLNIADCVKVVEGYIADSDVEKYFASSDLVVLPYISATQSGIVQIAYGFQKPVLVTNVGGLPDVVADDKTGYVVESRSALAIAEKVIDFFENDRQKEFAENIREEESRFSWDTFVSRVEELVGER